MSTIRKTGEHLSHNPYSYSDFYTVFLILRTKVYSNFIFFFSTDACLEKPLALESWFKGSILLIYVFPRFPLAIVTIHARGLARVLLRAFHRLIMEYSVIFFCILASVFTKISSSRTIKILSYPAWNT